MRKVKSTRVFARAVQFTNETFDEVCGLLVRCGYSISPDGDEDEPKLYFWWEDDEKEGEIYKTPLLYNWWLVSEATAEPKEEPYGELYGVSPELFARLYKFTED